MMFSSKQIQALDLATRDAYLRPLPQRKPSRAAPETIAAVHRLLDASPTLDVGDLLAHAAYTSNIITSEDMREAYQREIAT